MSQIQFNALDLNLLKVLDALLQERSVSQAARRLALTPSAVSHALARLRFAVGDDLFVRRASGLQPTARALEIAARLGPALDQVRAALDPVDFDPATAEREFTIIAGSYAAQVIVPVLVDGFRARAPNVRLRFTRLETGYAADVENGRADLALGAPRRALGALEWKGLFAESMVWVVRRDHPFVRAPLTTEMLRRAGHVLIDGLSQLFEENSTPGGRPAPLGGVDPGALARARTPYDIAVVVQDAMAALAIVARTDMVTLMPRRLALVGAYADRLQVLTPPSPMPDIEVGCFYRPERLSDPGFAWLLDQLPSDAPG